MEIVPSLLFIPVDVILGDMYLETDQYAKAAQHYVTYLTTVSEQRHTAFMRSFTLRGRNIMSLIEQLPGDFASSLASYASNWENIFSSYSDLLTYIPLAENSREGTTTLIPKTFGYDYYATSPSYIDEIQIVPSESYKKLSEDGEYYYTSTLSTSTNAIVNSVKLGDTRYNAITREDDDDESGETTVWITKNSGVARVLLYRTTTVYLHLAEAFNRLGMYDLAFAILKDGINKSLVDPAEEGGPSYISEASKAALKSTYPLLSEANISKFSDDRSYFGVHMHGAGITRDYTGTVYQPGLSPYQLDTVVTVKMDQIAEQYAVQVGTTKEDTINAVEDLLCDEYALEFAFEGNRFYDLCRLARHKNNAGLYGGNFGSLWLSRKLAYKNPQKDLTNPDNWYLPFK